MLNKLSELAPSKLFLASDGPRLNNPEDKNLIDKCWKIVDEYINWECKVEVLVSNKNYGCDDWMPKAITWFFENVDSGIILEDDCLIDSNFMRFATEMLDKYRYQSNVMNISAANFQSELRGNGDYYFSLYPANWAWASWARAWKIYDHDLNSVGNLFNSKEFNNIFLERKQIRYWRRFYCQLLAKKYTYWDAKWLLSIWANNGLSITPNYNLVTNIGFGKQATHTKIKSDDHCLKIQNLPINIKDPFPVYEVNREADKYLFNNRYKPRFFLRVKNLLWFIFGKMLKK